MNAYTLHQPPDRGRTSQWMLSAAAIVAAHLTLIAVAVAWYQQASPPGIDMPAIMVDMAPVPAAPTVQPQDLAPGPPMQQAPAAETPRQAEAEQPPEPEQPTAALASEPAPILPQPDVVLPPEAKQPPTREATKPQPYTVESTKSDTAKSEQAKRKPEPVKPKQRSHQPPAPRTTATPKAERQASLTTSAAEGRAAAAAALPSYRDRLAAHLARYKQYPTQAKAAGEQGVAMLSFTVGRHGQVLGSRLARSSGHADLDAETLAMIRRAQPLPSFPPEIAQASLSFTVPVRFSLR
jgi:protein TonB